MLPNSFLKIPEIPGQVISLIIKTSTFAQAFSPGLTSHFSAALARIFSVAVIGILVYSEQQPSLTLKFEHISMENREESEHNWASCRRAAFVLGGWHNRNNLIWWCFLAFLSLPNYGGWWRKSKETQVFLIMKQKYQRITNVCYLKNKIKISVLYWY